MHFCKICNYLTSTNHGLKNHYKTQKHLNMMALLNKSPSIDNETGAYEECMKPITSTYIGINEDSKSENLDDTNNIFDYNDSQFVCVVCKKKYKYYSGLKRHNKMHHSCENKNESPPIDSQIINIKKEHSYLLKIEKLKHKLEIKEIQNKHLQSYCDKKPNDSTINNVVNKNINIINNNVKISKIQYLNLNFAKVIDINTFIDNYKNKYGLTNQQAQTLLENYQSDGINGCITSLVHYLKKSAVQQYKELNGIEITTDNVILPFILSDRSLREHFEKSVNGKWDKTTMIDNIKKIVSITNDQVFKYHNQYMGFNGSQRKRIINGILKSSGYSILSQITNPDFYKLDNKSSEEDMTECDNIESLKKNNNTDLLTLNKKEITIVNQDDNFDDEGSEEDTEEEDSDEEDTYEDEDTEGGCSDENDDEEGSEYNEEFNSDYEDYESDEDSS
jgi:hypothetical protein